MKKCLKEDPAFHLKLERKIVAIPMNMEIEAPKNVLLHDPKKVLEIHELGFFGMAKKMT